ncbi:MAG: ribosome assembly RNA-binding protein YhbY [Acidobacteriota bacterium]
MSEAAAPELTGRQRKHLRGLAHGIRPTVQVGAEGASEAVLREVNLALDSHELIKVRLHEPDDKKALAAELAEGSSSALCGLVGHTVILYRAHPERPRISLTGAS